LLFNKALRKVSAVEQLVDFQTVTVYSELGVALAGFGMVGSVLSSRRGSAHPALDAFRLRMLVNGSAALTFGGLFPFVLGNFSLPLPVVWKTASLFFFISLFVVLLLGLRGTLDLRRQGYLQSRAATITLFSMATLSLTILSLNFFITNNHFLKGIYLSSLTIHSAAGFILFARVFSSLFKAPPNENS
jgi:hypothetical protein